VLVVAVADAAFIDLATIDCFSPSGNENSNMHSKKRKHQSLIFEDFDGEAKLSIINRTVERTTFQFTCGPFLDAARLVLMFPTTGILAINMWILSNL
jgi:hypothetical protein